MKIVGKSSDQDRHKEDFEAVVVFKDKVFSAADDGKVKIWSKSDLSLLHQFNAHDYAILHLLIFNDLLYTASSDQTVKVWKMDTWSLQHTLVGHEDTPNRVVTDGQYVFSGDSKGEVFKWDVEGKLLDRIEVCEEVWGLHVQKNRIYSIRDRGLTVTETKDNSKIHSATCVVEGRAPILVTEKDLLVCSMSGTSVSHFTNTPPKCEYQRELKGDHDKIITVLGGFGEFLLSGGWDNKLILWNLHQGLMVSSVELPGCPTAIAVSEEDQTAFVGGADGYLIKLSMFTS